MEKIFMTAHEVAQISGLNYQRVLRDIKAGNLSAQTMAGAYLITVSDAEEYIRRSKVTTDPAYVLDLEAQVASLKVRLERLGQTV